MPRTRTIGLTITALAGAVFTLAVAAMGYRAAAYNEGADFERYRIEPTTNRRVDAHGTPEGGMTFASGQRGQAFSLNGVTDAMFIGGAAIPVPWTAAFWVNRQDTPDISAALLSDNVSALKLEQWPSTRQVGFTQFGVADYSFGYIAPAGTWLQLTLVGSPAGTTLYVNGAFVQTISAVVSLPLQTLGRRGTGQDRLRGLLDEITIFNRALSPAEIQQLHNTTRGP